MPQPWSGSQKTNLNSVESAITTALASFTLVNDPWHAGVRQTLLQMMRLLEQVKVERNA
jgi:hypothetical protein